MSRIGKKPVAVPSGVTVDVKGNVVTVKGPKGSLTFAHLPEVSIRVEGSEVVVGRSDDSDAAKARHGLTRQLIQNMVIGVMQGYEKQLEIIGVGYKAALQGKKITLHLGYSHPLIEQIPEGIDITQDEKNKNILIIRGIDKQLVGQVAATLRGFRPPEPYKGKGVRYVGEDVRRKPGKAAVKGAIGGEAA